MQLHSASLSWPLAEFTQEDVISAIAASTPDPQAASASKNPKPNPAFAMPTIRASLSISLSAVLRLAHN
jgi:hypothetical protein